MIAHSAGEKSQDKAALRMDAGALAQVGALISAVFASACCWLPLLLVAFGVSGGTLSAAFEAWRPVLLPVTFVLLAVAFYVTYRKPKAAAATADEAGFEAVVVPTESIGVRITGMTCRECPPIVQTALRAIEGVEDVTVGFKSSVACVTRERGKASVEELRRAVSAAGGSGCRFAAEVIDGPSSSTAGKRTREGKSAGAQK